MKKIGVVIPVYNAEKSIEKSINSLLNQTFKDWLAIIINDGSTDNTVEIINNIKMMIGFIYFILIKTKEDHMHGRKA